MSVTNATIAELLRRYAALLSLEGVDRFKLKAYRRAAETIEGLDDSVEDRVRSGDDLTELPGIGKAISAVIHEVVTTGKLARLDETAAKLPPERVELATKPRLDPRKVARIYKKLGIGSLKELESALATGAIREAFDARMEFHVRQGLDQRPRQLLWSVEEMAERIEERLRSLPGVTRVSATGSLRRKQETVGDLGFLVAAKSAKTVFEEFGRFGAVQSSQTIGPRERLYRLSSGISVSVRHTPAKQWGLSLLQATGSAAHLQDLEAHAEALRLPLAPTLAKQGVDSSEESEIYAALGLSYVEPELRESRGEVSAAAEGRLPKLVTLGDLRGDLHMHTTASDGANTIEQMAAAAKARGYAYIAITDHSQSLKIARGLTEKRLLEHLEEIDEANATLQGIRVLKSAEVDILEEGKLDYSNAILKRLDFTICSIHSRFAINREKQTERILRAMDNPYFNILGHATGRLLLSREGYEIDFERIVEHARANGCLFEINSSPNRLDLSDEHAKMAQEAGIKIAVNTDAHSVAELGFISAGVNQARRAWLSAADVLNAQPLKKMLTLLRR
jgi:DNA polymerase (family 10)